MSRERPSSAVKGLRLFGAFVLGMLIAFSQSALVLVAIPVGLLLWLVLLPAAILPLPEMWRACRSPLFCIKLALLMRDALLCRTLARPLAGTGPNQWPWPWNESPAEIRRYGLFSELI